MQTGSKTGFRVCGNLTDLAEEKVIPPFTHCSSGKQIDTENGSTGRYRVDGELNHENEFEKIYSAQTLWYRGVLWVGCFQMIIWNLAFPQERPEQRFGCKNRGQMAPNGPRGSRVRSHDPDTVASISSRTSVPN
jgi:hypothetical protein